MASPFVVCEGDQFTATVDSIPGLVLTGTWNAIGGYSLVGDGIQQGCNVRVVLVTDDVGNVAVAQVDAGVGLGVSCGGVGCQLIYLGTLTRQ